jgi:hypothetical protein
VSVITLREVIHRMRAEVDPSSGRHPCEAYQSKWTGNVCEDCGWSHLAHIVWRSILDLETLEPSAHPWELQAGQPQEQLRKV